MKHPNINEEAYTNRELFMLIEQSNEASAEFHKTVTKQLEELVIQTKKTNGNVMDLLLWRAYVKGQVWIVPLIVSALISGIIALGFKYVF